jgi:di/tricarboxylate transporter
LTTPQISVFTILLLLFAMLAWGRWRYDVVAFIALLAAVVAGVVPAGQAFAGFGHPATITVAAVLILSRALSSCGATDFIAKAVQPATGRPIFHIGALSGIAAVMSSFMNNVGTLAILMPVALQSAIRAKRPASMLLMPLSFGSILGGLVTLIGTPPNIIIATYRGETTGTPFRMFDFAPVGATTALAGVIFIVLIGWRLVPQSSKPGGAADELLDIDSYVTELLVPKDSPHIGKTLAEIDAATKDIDAVVVDLIRKDRRYPGGSTRKQLMAGDILKIEAGPKDIDRFIAKLGLTLASAKSSSLPGAEDPTLMEAVVAPGSRLEGRTVGSLRLFSNRGVMLLAVSRQGEPFHGRLRAFRLRVGDVLLLHGEADGLPDAVKAAGCLPLAERALNFGKRSQAPAMIGIFAAAIAATSLGLLPIQIAFGLAIMAMVVTGLLPLRELYDGIDWPVIVLLGSLIPVGGALETTGATGVIAGTILTLTTGLSATLVLALLMVVTMTLSDVLNNAATAVVMAPIGVSVAERLGVNSDPFLMAVAVAASCAFLTPIGHQNNALIMGPGGYRFGDYWRMGVPLEVLVIAVSLPMILLVWPL